MLIFLKSYKVDTVSSVLPTYNTYLNYILVRMLEEIYFGHFSPSFQCGFTSI